MRTIKILEKDLKSFFRDFRSFFLIFLTPVIIVIIIGLSFIGSSPSNIKIAICSIENNDIDNYISSNVNNSGFFIIEKIYTDRIDECREAINQKIKASDIRAGVLIPQKSEYDITKVEIITDNSKLVSEYIKSYFTIITNDISQKIANQYIDIVFSNIEEVKKTLDNVEFDLRDEIKNIDIIKKDLENTRTQLIAVRTDIQNAKQSLTSVENLLDSSILTINNTAYMIENGIKGINNAISIINLLNSTEYQKYQLFTELSTSKDQLTYALTNLRNAKSTISSAKYTINSVKNNLNSDSLNTPISTIDNTIISLDNSKNTAEYALDKVSELKKTLINFDIKKPPSTQFVDSKITDFFSGNRFIDFLFPSTVIMVMMIISTFLASITFIRQRLTGLLQRISLAPNGCRLIIIERLLFIMTLSIIAFPIIVLSCSFGLNINLSLYSSIGLFFTVVISSLIFASIGLVIAILSKYESTAILLSIVITLPMIFLSGILVPLERLPSYLTFIINILPLNVSIRGFENIAFYSVDIFFILYCLSILLIYILFFSTIAWILIKREFKR